MGSAMGWRGWELRNLPWGNECGAPERLVTEEGRLLAISTCGAARGDAELMKEHVRSGSKVRNPAVIPVVLAGVTAGFRGPTRSRCLTSPATG